MLYAFEGRHSENHEHDNDILDDKDSYAQSSWCRLQFFPISQELQDHDGAAEGKSYSQKSWGHHIES